MQNSESKQSDRKKEASLTKGIPTIRKLKQIKMKRARIDSDFSRLDTQSEAERHNHDAVYLEQISQIQKMQLEQQKMLTALLQQQQMLGSYSHQNLQQPGLSNSLYQPQQQQAYFMPYMMPPYLPQGY